jgi:hypothetical protein
MSAGSVQEMMQQYTRIVVLTLEVLYAWGLAEGPGLGESSTGSSSEGSTDAAEAPPPSSVPLVPTGYTNAFVAGECGSVGQGQGRLGSRIISRVVCWGNGGSQVGRAVKCVDEMESLGIVAFAPARYSAATWSVVINLSLWSVIHECHVLCPARSPRMCSPGRHISRYEGISSTHAHDANP